MSKPGGKLRQGSRSRPKFLGVKVSDAEKVKIGRILIRQRGTVVAPGEGVDVGRDHTLFATKSGTVKFGQRLGKRQVSII